MRVPNRLGRGLATGFVDVVRNIPLLVVLCVLFYALPANGVPATRQLNMAAQGRRDCHPVLRLKTSERPVEGPHEPIRPDAVDRGIPAIAPRGKSSHRTPRWSKGDSNWRSHLVRCVVLLVPNAPRQCSG